MGVQVVEDRPEIVCVIGCGVGRGRATLKRQLKAGQRSLHFRKESDRRRRAILAAMLGLEWHGYVVRADGPDSRSARAECLRAVADLSARHGVNELVIERDDSVLERDRRMLFSHLAGHDQDSRIRYRHLGRHEDPLLWIADAVAWSVARGGEWRRRVSGRVIESRVRE